MTADLHVHSNLSDGTQTPEQVVIKAHKAGLKTIALTDHDVVAGIPVASSKGQELGVEVL
ncbi:MAG: PHP domain-containing protein, partial [bacterium]